MDNSLAVGFLLPKLAIPGTRISLIPREEVKECYLLKLPIELRIVIWRTCLLRPTGIVPSFIEYRDMRSPVAELSKYRYMWDDYRLVRRDELQIPPRNGSLGAVQVTWTTKPSPEQELMIENGVTELPPTKITRNTGSPEGPYNSSGSDMIQHLVHRRHGLGIEIINQRMMHVPNLISAALLRTNRTISEEALGVLYGENTFVFDSRKTFCPKWYTRPVQYTSDHRAFRETRLDEGDRDREDIRGRWEEALEVAVTPNALTNFFEIIGSTNASRITSVKVQGYFRNRESFPLFRNDNPCPAFGDLLHSHTTILNEVCKNLKKLTLSCGNGNNLRLKRIRYLWKGEAGLFEQSYSYMAAIPPAAPIETDDEKIDKIVEKVVEGLPWLEELRLGDYKHVPQDQGFDEWGSSVRWMGIVEERARARKSNSGQVLDVPDVNGNGTMEENVRG